MKNLLSWLFLCCLHLPDVVTGGIFSQWAATVINYSTQNGPTWAAAYHITGQPDQYPTYGGAGLQAWAPVSIGTTNEFIEFQINTSVCVTSVSTYETWNFGFVVKILALNPNSIWDELWSGTATWIQSSRIFSPPLRSVSYTTKSFRINMDGSAAGSNWIELDAVRVDGSQFCFSASPLIHLDASDSLNAAKLTDNNATSCVSGKDSAMLRYRFNQTIFNQTSINMPFNVTVSGSNLRCSPSTSPGYYLFAVSGQLTNSSGTAVYSDEHSCKLGNETSLSCRFECNCQSSSCGMLALWYIGCGTPPSALCDIFIQ